MNYTCPDCKRLCLGEQCSDPLLEPAIVCEYCGTVLEFLTEKGESRDEYNPE